MEIKASARYIKTTPRKIRTICNLIKGENLNKATVQLYFKNKQAALDISSLLKSATASAKQKDLKPEDLYIKEIRCDEGPSLKRILFRSKGRATPIKKRMSHVTLILSDELKSKVKIKKSKPPLKS